MASYPVSHQPTDMTPGSGTRPTDNQRISMIFGLLVAAFFRIVSLDGKSLWLDEILTLSVMDRGVAALWSGQSDNYHPPLYFMLLDLWEYLGDSVFQLRYFSALMALMATVLAFAIAKILFGRTSAITALWLMAAAPLLIWYGQEMRNYSLLLALGLASVLGIAGFSAMSPRYERASWGAADLGWWFVFVVGTAGALYTHYIAIVLLPIQLALFVALWGSRRTSRAVGGLLLIGWFVVFLLYLPWLQTPSIRAFRDLATGDQTFNARQIAQSLNVELSDLLQLVVLAAALVIPVVIGSIYWLFRRPAAFWHWVRTYRLFQIFLVVLVFLTLLVSTVPRGYTVKRQILIFWPFALIALSWFWPWCRSHRQMLSTLLLFTFLGAGVTLFAVQKDDWRAVVRYIHDHYESADHVLLMPPYMTIPFDYYDRQLSPDVGLLRTGVSPSLVPDQMPEIVASHPRVWFVAHTVDNPDPTGIVRNWLSSHMKRVDERSFYRIEVSLYEQQLAQ